MLGFEIKQAAITYKRAVEDNKPFFEALSIFSNWFQGVEDRLGAFAAGGATLHNEANAVHAHLASSGIAAPIKGSTFYGAASTMAKLLRGLFPRMGNTPDAWNHAQELANDIQELVDLYDTFASEKSGKSALPLILAGRALQGKITEFGETLQLVADALSTNSPPLAQGEEEFTMLFGSTQTIRSFWEKLRAIEELYRLLCELFDVQEDQHPLRVIKIESGSLLVQLAGSAVVVAFFIKVIWASVGFIHRNYITEGRIASSNTRLRIIRDNMNLVDELAKGGIDTTEMKHDLRMSARAITEQLSYVLDDESYVKVNNHTYRAEPRFDALPQLGQPSPPLLLDKTNRDGV